MVIPPINLYSIAKQSVYEEFLYSIPWIEKKKIKYKENSLNRMQQILTMRN